MISINEYGINVYVKLKYNKIYMISQKNLYNSCKLEYIFTSKTQKKLKQYQIQILVVLEILIKHKV